MKPMLTLTFAIVSGCASGGIDPRLVSTVITAAPCALEEAKTVDDAIRMGGASQAALGWLDAVAELAHCLPQVIGPWLHQSVEHKIASNLDFGQIAMEQKASKRAVRRAIIAWKLFGPKAMGAK